MDNYIAIALVIGVLLLGAFGYLLLMILFPESVGIQGKIAEQHRKEHEYNPSEDLVSSDKDHR